MISNGILYIVYAWLSGVGALINAGGFADVKPNSWIVGSVTTVSGILNFVWSVLPLTIIALITSALAVVVLFEGGLAAYKLIKWGYQKIPGIT